MEFKRFAPIVLVLAALVMTLLSIFGETGYSRLMSLRRGLLAQKEHNASLNREIQDISHQINSLQKDNRAIEKVAREQLGMARPNEKIFFFEKRR